MLQEENEIEIAMLHTGTGYVALGWKPNGMSIIPSSSSTTLFPCYCCSVPGSVVGSVQLE